MIYLHLDVAYFCPLKIKWRQVLMQWKDSQQGRKFPTTPKEVFPNLLNKALDGITESKSDLIAGFRRTGICPQDKEEPLKRLPRQDRIIHPDLITDSFLQKLEHLRNKDYPAATKNKKKKLNVPPGKSICIKDIEESGPSSELAGCLGELKPNTKKTKKGGKPRLTRESSTTECSDQMSLASSTEDLIISYRGIEKESCSDNDNNLSLKVNDYDIGDYVLVKWNSIIYPGQITSLNEEGVLVNCMKKGKTYWRWPSFKDEQLYSWNYILKKISVPKFIHKGNFTIPEISAYLTK